MIGKVNPDNGGQTLEIKSANKARKLTGVVP
jgi:hypothetical protein